MMIQRLVLVKTGTTAAGRRAVELKDSSLRLRSLQTECSVLLFLVEIYKPYEPEQPVTRQVLASFAEFLLVGPVLTLLPGGVGFLDQGSW